MEGFSLLTCTVTCYFSTLLLILLRSSLTLSTFCVRVGTYRCTQVSLRQGPMP